VNNDESPIKSLRYLLQADLTVMMRNGRSLILSIFLPVLLLFVSSSNKAITRFGGPTYIFAISITIGIVESSLLGYALTVARDRDGGIFQRLRVTPIPSWAIMVSRLLVQVLVNLMIAIVVLIAGSLIYHVNLSVVGSSLALLMAIVGGAVFLCIGQAIVGLLKTADTVNAAVRIVFIVLFLLGFLGISGLFGGTLQQVAKWSPVGTVMALLQNALSAAPWSLDTTYALLANLGYIIVFSFIGIKWFQWDSQ
jgi:ABC-2 type transport system permease protein